jgi:hypothetical protein
MKMEIKIMPKNAEFFCNICDFKCYKKSNYDIHCKTIKHVYRHNGNKMENAEINKNAAYGCECGKKYATNSGLWKHLKICKCKNKDHNNSENTNNELSEKELMMMILKDNSELKNIIFEVVKNGTNNTTNNNTTHTNSHNKTFNLNVFLNETCKDAMNIMDFVDSIKLQLTDLENVGKLGYVEGISNIIVQNLNAMDVHKRPVHCADKKREVIYIKDDNKWEKENDDKKKIRQAIRRVAAKNQRLIPNFKEAHPDCNKYHSKFSDQYNKIIVESMGGSGDNDIEKEDKIIKNISKNVVIDKD